MRLHELPTPDEVIAFRESGIRLICPGDPEWPGQLADLGDDQPYALWLRGNADLRFNCLRSVAIVGSRAATAYGSYVAAEFAASVAARGWAVVSGGAFGVDAAAHRGALGADGVTVAVLACGVDVPYPVGPRGAVRRDRRPGRDRQRMAARPAREQAQVPGPQPGDRRPRDRDAGGGGGRAQRGGQHRPARQGPRPAPDGGARPRHLRPVRRMPPHHPGMAGHPRHQAAEVIEHLSPVGTTLEPTNAPAVTDPAGPPRAAQPRPTEPPPAQPRSAQSPPAPSIRLAPSIRPGPSRRAGAGSARRSTSTPWTWRRPRY